MIINELKEIAFKKIKYERDNKLVKVLTHVYEILDYSGNLENKEPHKHIEQKFISIDEIKKIPYLSDSTIFFLESIGFKREAKLE